MSKITTTWDLTSIFATETEWRAEIKCLIQRAIEFAGKRKHILSSAQSLFQALREVDDILARFSVVTTYADLSFYSNTCDPKCTAYRQEARAASGRIDEEMAFLEPDLLALSKDVVASYLDQSEELRKDYGFYLAELERGRAHTLSFQEEQLLSVLSPLASGPEQVRESLHDADMKFPSLTVGDRIVSHGTIDELLQSSDRETREAAFKTYWGEYLRYPNTFASTLSLAATSSAAFARARKYSSAFEESMFDDAFPASIRSTVINVCRESYPLFQRYFRAKAQLLGINKLAEYDIFATLSTNAPPIEYERGVQVVFDALKPLGDEYVSIARKGVCEESWVDVYPRAGKYSNAFSAGTVGTKPYFLLNFAPTMPELGTFAHELGHSVHSYKTQRAQSYGNTHYAMSVAETASNLNQVLLREHVLANCDRTTALAVLDEAFYFAHRYLFMMPTLSRVEHLLHSFAARGQSLDADELQKFTIIAFNTAYGDAVESPDQYTGMKWASFCHFYMPYYMFQYAIGISAAMSIGQRILSNEPGIVEKYHTFLSAGRSMSVIDTFKIVDEDITSPQMYRSAMKVVEGYVQKLEELARGK